jgi:adenine-specific DNA glycosylase
LETGDVRPWEVLPGEVLLQRTTATVVEMVFERLVSRYPEPEAILSATRHQLVEDLSPLAVRESGQKTSSSAERAASEARWMEGKVEDKTARDRGI